jgi:hypothetical protein
MESVGCIAPLFSGFEARHRIVGRRRQRADFRVRPAPASTGERLLTSPANGFRARVPARFEGLSPTHGLDRLVAAPDGARGVSHRECHMSYCRKRVEWVLIRSAAAGAAAPPDRGSLKAREPRYRIRDDGTGHHRTSGRRGASRLSDDPCLLAFHRVNRASRSCSRCATTSSESWVVFCSANRSSTLRANRQRALSQPWLQPSLPVLRIAQRGLGAAVFPALNPAGTLLGSRPNAEERVAESR